jgi:MYXO-CTERM domain-containing protein
MKLRHHIAGSVVALSAGLFAVTASAGPVIYNLSLPNINTFDNVIIGTGSTVVTAQVVQGTTVYNYTDKDGNPATVTVARPGGGAASMDSGYSSNGQSLSGAVWNINPAANPAGGGVGGKADIPGFNSGLTFTFSSPVNAFGFEIGDWATCCTGNTRPTAVQADYGVPAQGSGLWIAFDGGAATLPANALSDNDNPGYAAASSYTNFIGAIDSSSFFSKVTFFGDGFGEFLVAGGTLRFASVPKGSVGTVAEPSVLAMAGLALVALAGLRRRRAD